MVHHMTYHNVNKKKVWEKSIKFSDKNASSTNLFWQNVDVNNAKDESKKIKFLNILTHKYFKGIIYSSHFSDNQEAIFLIYKNILYESFFARSCKACSLIQITIKCEDETPIFGNAK